MAEAKAWLIVVTRFWCIEYSARCSLMLFFFNFHQPFWSHIVNPQITLPTSGDHLRGVLEAGFGYLGAGDHAGYFVGAGAVV